MSGVAGSASRSRRVELMSLEFWLWRSILMFGYFASKAAMLCCMNFPMGAVLSVNESSRLSVTSPILAGSVCTSLVGLALAFGALLLGAQAVTETAEAANANATYVPRSFTIISFDKREGWPTDGSVARVGQSPCSVHTAGGLADAGPV